ncbi:hypothetical protein [Tuberibacillus sp. Marseille-P3662]|uniref:hypothetical protein n=1 Tax=Tuberibacillus sp. Marseille-P3662 TaxID=1965358 RepID=UPI00111C06B8|nr:hypothetical protein [Tuberibacillus sp. Marseille-P3662]
MPTFFSPEIMNPNFHVLNVVDSNKTPVGYTAFLFDEKKMYIYGQVEQEGLAEDYKDMVKPYVEGITKANPDLNVYSYFSIGGKPFSIDTQKDESQ